MIAGYPWFGDWGRDTFISLPGLLLATGRHQEAGEVLAAFAEHLSEGMIPNRFNDYDNKPEYNTVDASLWFVHAAHEYARLSGDATRPTSDFVREAVFNSLTSYVDLESFSTEFQANKLNAICDFIACIA